MSNILIPTKPEDGHALYVKLALQTKGHQATVWYTADFPQQQTQTFKFCRDHIEWQFRGVDFEIDTRHKFDVIWRRRAKRPVLSPFIHSADVENTTNEMNTFYKSIWHVLEPNAFWINPLHTLAAANCKLTQLKMAAEVGLLIPKTLLSNDPYEIKAFINEHPVDEVIYKPLCPVYWLSEDEKSIRLTYTKNIKLSELPPDPILQNATGIFQQKIEKAFELRITYLGNYAVTAKLHSQEHPKGIMDWRYIPKNELTIEPFNLPQDIHEKCKALMKKLGIVFGFFDFIVTPDGEYYFLEVNEQGQFLWIEDINPKIKLLDPFTSFLAHGSEDFDWEESSHSVALSTYSNEVKVLQKNAIRRHIHPGTPG